MLKMTMEQYGSEPPPNLVLVLDLLTILPAHHLHGVGIGSQELTIINPSYTALNNENYEFNNWNNSDELAPANSGADAKTDAPEEAFVSRTTFVQGIVFVVVLPVFTCEFQTVNPFEVFKFIESVSVINQRLIFLILFSFH